MTAWNVIIAAAGGHPSPLHELKERLLRVWPNDPPLDLVVEESASFDAESVAAVHAVVLVIPAHVTNAAIREQVTTLEESGVAILALLESATAANSVLEYAGAMLEHLECDDGILCHKLHGLLHRQAEVGRLREEVSVAYRFHGGLKGEIARMHDELQLAAMVQREFLPRQLPDLNGVEFAALWRPAHYVSGDIYDISRLDDDHVGVFLADAVGHGVPAALMTMVITRSLTPKIINGASYKILDPSEVLERMNLDMIRRQGRTTRFATAAYAVVNCRTRTMRFAGAGHPAPYLISETGEVRRLETDGGLLGVFENETYSQIEVPLAVGDRLLLFSDGFEQAFPDAHGDEYARRLPTMRYEDEFIAAAAASTPQEVIDLICRRLDDQQGSLHQIDDLTFLCMHAQALPAATPAAENDATLTSVTAE